MVAAEVAADFEGVFDGDVGKVLVTEGDDLLFGDEEGEFVFLGVGELAQLDAVDFSAGVGSYVMDGGILEEVGEGWVGVFAVLDVGEGLPGG